MTVKTGQIGIALAAEQDDLAMDIGLVLLGREAAVIILPVAGCHGDILRQFKKIFTVAAHGTGQTATGTASWNFNFFLHQIKKSRRSSCKQLFDYHHSSATGDNIAIML